MNDIITNEIIRLRDRGALFVINHSGGKDSQAMRIRVQELVPVEQILVVHADLKGAEWEGTFEHVLEDCKDRIPRDRILRVEGNKTFETMVLWRGFWPSPSYRQCTSDLKRGPLERDIRRWLKPRMKAGTENGIVVNCMGLRAGESPNRAKKKTLKFNKLNSKAGREWYDWLPIQDWKCVTDRNFDPTVDKEQVFTAIAKDGKDVHPAYKKGMKRLSCVFCIMACGHDLKVAAENNPEMYARYVAMEDVIDQTFVMPTKKHGKRTLEEVTGVKADPNKVATYKLSLGNKRAALHAKKAA